jgi:putative membrane protein
MVGALTLSSVFLASYVVYHLNAGSRVPGSRADSAVYFTILITHVVLAATILPLALLTATRGLRAQFDRHVRIARDAPALALRVGHGCGHLSDAVRDADN